MFDVAEGGPGADGGGGQDWNVDVNGNGLGATEGRSCCKNVQRNKKNKNKNKKSQMEMEMEMDEMNV